ncbi:DUF1566 domain-containing protein [Aquabacterium sp.]|uniref:Lcl C-terminal domain-containing protein n=1 Tax=Aquabacterium sp. TaxID=1872578 RepID=UPI002487518F|nr:DUF1566 domain-containing protein [Aquabacterium sp.]MDI1260502.1 DUF1566 domain-containing protein [Aquabacterium sp.]
MNKTGSKHRWLALGLAFGLAWAGEPNTAARFSPTEDGASVIDLQTTLVWSRCVEGMAWNGKSCKGKPKLANHAEAIMLAKSRKEAEGLSWRLPRAPELQKLAKWRASSPSLSAELFPAAPQDWYWSVTANVHSAPVNQYNYGNIQQGRTEGNANRMAFLHGWAVNSETGLARGDVAKSARLPVRLVRMSD